MARKAMQENQAAGTDAIVAKKRRPSGSENRKEQRVRTLRISEKQDAELVRNALAAGISVGGYIRRRCCSAQHIQPRKIIPVEVQAVLQLRGQLGRLGNNLNQIVRRENFNENPYAHEYQEALAGVRETIAECHALLRDAHRKAGV